MRNDHLQISLNTAAKLEEAFKRDGWEIEEVENLIAGHTLSLMKGILKGGTVHAKLMLGYPVKVREVFTYWDVVKEFGHSERVLSQLLNALDSDYTMLLYDLVNKTEKRLLGIPYIGEACLQIVRDIFKKHGLQFGVQDYPPPIP